MLSDAEAWPLTDQFKKLPRDDFSRPIVTPVSFHHSLSGISTGLVVQSVEIKKAIKTPKKNKLNKAIYIQKPLAEKSHSSI